MEFNGIQFNMGQLWADPAALLRSLGAGESQGWLNPPRFVLHQVGILQQQIPAEDPAQGVRPAQVQHRAALREAGAQTRHRAGPGWAAGPRPSPPLLPVSQHPSKLSTWGLKMMAWMSIIQL